ncbi:MAG: carbohydrate porin [Verrucomicrobiota bacterium]
MSIGLASHLKAVDAFHAARAHYHFRTSLEHFGSKEVRDRKELQPLWRDLNERKYLLGNLWGWRNDLADNGIAIDLNFVVNVAGNPVGGREQGITELNSTGLGFGIDFEKLADVEGLTFFSSLSVRSGTSLSLSKIGNVINVQQLYGNESYRLVNLYLEQVLLDQQVGIKVGRIAQFDDFAHAGAFGYYMNNAFDGQPIGFFFMGPFTAYPVTTWGALVRGGILTGRREGFYGMVGAYGADDDLPNVDNHGTNFSFNFNKGANLMAEVGYKFDWTSYGEGNPGKYALGGWWFTGPFENWNGGRTHGAGGIYFLIHQNLWRESDFAPQDKPPELSVRNLWGTTEDFLKNVEGLFFWSTAQFASDTKTAASDWFYNGGFYYRGLLPQRDRDVLSFGLAYLSFSNDIAQSQIDRGRPPQDYEMELELSYRYVVNDFFYLQPNIQGIINPGGAGTIDHALVLGLQFQVTF